ncbi:MAG: ATP-binding protein [Chitinophagales bacterium]
MTVRYETQEKEKALAQEKLKVAEHELKIENKNNQLLIISIVFITLALLGFIFINQQRFKNKQLEREKELNTALAKIETNNKLQNQRLEISRDLHDSIGSQLTFIISSIENLKMFLTNSDNFVGDKLSSLSEFTKDTIQELRDTIWAMNKNEISIEDLNTRISNFINQAKVSLQNINFSFNSSVPENTNFESKKGMHIYRIIQESVNNAIKHSDASEIKVSITQNDKENMIQIEDNGKGFNIDENLNKGNGLNSLRKRAEEIQGKLYIESAKNKTTVTLITKTL